MNIRVIGIIPARYKSTRLPGKPLVDIGGKPMIQRVWERVQGSKYADKIIIATDDKRIYDTVKQFTSNVMMTPEELTSGTDRVAYTARTYTADIIINIQGDEPFITSDEIDQVSEILIDDPEPVMGTLVKKIKTVDELTSPHTAKVVIDRKGYAVYFSRSPIPFNRIASDINEWLRYGTYYKHIGIYSYRKKYLEKFSQYKPAVLENMEKLEQLRVLENGDCIKTAVTNYESQSVDTEEDLKMARIRCRNEINGE